MSFELSVLQAEGYLHLRVTGRNSTEVVRAYFARVAEICTERGCPYILVEENLLGSGLKLGEIYHLVADGSQRVLPHIQCLAYVDVNPENSLADMQFAENVAVNRGLNFRVFASIAEAETWIRAESRRFCG